MSGSTISSAFFIAIALDCIRRGDLEGAVLAEAEAASLAPAEAPFGSTTVAEA